MEKEFTEWFEANGKRFAHGQFDEKQIAYSAWLEGKKQALTIHNVSNMLCGSFDPDTTTSSATKCKCGREKWEHPKAT